MFKITLHDDQNLIYINLKGVITEEQTARAVRELNNTVRSMPKMFRMILDLRRFNFARKENAIPLVQNALRIMALRRPSVILRLGSRQTLNYFNDVYQKLNIQQDFLLVDAKTPKAALRRLHAAQSSNPGMKITLLHHWLQDRWGVEQKKKTVSHLPETPIDLARFVLSEVPVQHRPVCIGVKPQGIAIEDCLYFRFSHSFNSDTAPVASHWISMTSEPVIREQECHFAFEKSGRYLIRVEVSRNPDEWDAPDVAQAIMTVFVRPDTSTTNQNAHTADNSDPLFQPDTTAEFILNREDTASAATLPTRIFESDPHRQTMVVAQTDPPILSIHQYQSLDIAREIKKNQTVKRLGFQITSVKPVENYQAPDQTIKDALFISVTPHLKTLGLRRERRTFRCNCKPYARYIQGKLILSGRTLVAGRQFEYQDLSATGAGLVLNNAAPEDKEAVRTLKTGRKGAIELRLLDMEGKQAPIILPLTFVIVHQQFYKEDQSAVLIGVRFDEMAEDHQEALIRFLNTLQLLERRRLAEKY